MLCRNMWLFHVAGVPEHAVQSPWFEVDTLIPSQNSTQCSHVLAHAPCGQPEASSYQWKGG